ncbi:MAG: STAS domain-containing protein [Bacteroidales bacterium]|nr:STAS domain-containing protein [Bacteroidales bacterium]MBQ7517645.1 STAS domain-containing protein [Bacteroidales bacterium]
MEVKVISPVDKVLVQIKGRVDTTNAAQFQEDLTFIMQGDMKDIELDCSGLEYTSSQGLRVFLMLQKAVQGRGGKMVLTHMQTQVKEVFDITGFSNIIKIL